MGALHTPTACATKRATVCTCECFPLAPRPGGRTTGTPFCLFVCACEGKGRERGEGGPRQTRDVIHSSQAHTLASE